MAQESDFFKWEEDSAQPPKHLEENQNTKIKKLLNFIAAHRNILVLVTIVASLSVMSSLSREKHVEEKKGKYSPVTITAFVSMWPIPKGEEVPVDFLKPISLASKSLTRTQKLQLFEGEFQAKRGMQLIAKKDIAPNKPIFWRDLKLHRLTPMAEAKEHTPISIQYGKENKK